MLQVRGVYLRMDIVIAHGHRDCPVDFSKILENLHTFCLPSAISDQQSMLKFGHLYLPALQLCSIELDSELIFWKPSIRKMFVDNFKRLRIMKSSDAIGLAMRRQIVRQCQWFHQQ
ncbi:hypothetical protein RHMOL_Rhmol08G0015900 [Rhododendron molle]|uniref:Uncharacterized protein n=2 Tax=Rhododendron molle TaxID=49168 RepID=A0ACC0MIX4_RHOML|nr:hypothetical protein RHMOL_Rhmol08G0015900 [Rhododendron molle]KAI8540840.1 hypothetical protein RHMOL_Rhmol08G0015900 [Rhododendron molle]